MADLGWQAWLTLLTLFGVVGMLFSGRVPSDLATLAGLGLLLITGAVSVEEGLAGFSNRGVLTIGVLFVVAALVRNSGALSAITGHLYSSTGSLRTSLLRLMVPTASISAFLNNTPVVALLLPGTSHWARKRGFGPAKVLLPLSYASILGGTCTLIGSSTNLVVVGLLQEGGHAPLGFFDIGLVGGPIALAGILYLTVFGPLLLPEKSTDDGAFDDPTTFTTEAIVDDNGALPGTALADAQVGDLQGLYPVEVRRAGVLIPAPKPDLVLMGGDRLVLAGAAAEFVRLHRSADLITVSQHNFDVPPPVLSRRRVIEVVLSDHCPLIGDEVGDGTFRRHYGAAVMAISRGGGRDSEDMLDWRLRVGDRLLLEAGDGFDSHRRSRDFFVTTELSDLEDGPVATRGWVSLLVALAMIVSAALGLVGLLEAAIAAAAVLFILNPTSGVELRKAVDWQVVLTIAAAFGLAAAVQKTGLAGSLADGVIGLGGDSVWIALCAVYLATFILTEIITNNAAAALSFPLAIAVASELGVSATPFAIVVMIAASASFISPLGYQTNLMVYGAGNYHARDFLRIGWPLSVITAALAIGLTPLFFPF